MVLAHVTARTDAESEPGTFLRRTRQGKRGGTGSSNPACSSAESDARCSSERRLATHRRGNHDLGASVLERVVGRGELLEALTPVFEQGALQVPKINGWRMERRLDPGTDPSIRIGGS